MKNSVTTATSGRAAFLRRYPVPLQELLLAPLLFREFHAWLGDLPVPTDRTMRALAAFGGHTDGAIRTALSRLRSAGDLQPIAGPDGATRYRLSEFSRGVSRAVRGRVERPEGFLLAIFSFAASDDRERQVVRDALRYQGFQRLAQNAYINGRIDPAPLEAVFQAHGLSDRVFLFPCTEPDDPALRKRLLRLFDVEGRRKVLARLRDDLHAFLDAPGLPADELAQRFLYAGPVHYRVTYVEEPPLPASYLPEHYPLQELVELMDRPSERRAAALRAFLERTSTER